MTRLAVVLWLAGLAFAQTDRVVSVGVMGGVPLLDAFQATDAPTACPAYCSIFNWYPATKRYTAGVAFELHLHGRFSMEADALYNRLD